MFHVKHEGDAGPAALLVARCAAMGVELDGAAAGRLVALLDRLALEGQNLTRIEGLDDGLDRHLADSLAALTLPAVAGAAAALDLGSGAGFPGLALAAARPEARLTLVESERRKAEWLVRASASFPNVRVVAERSEDVARREREAWPLVTVRAVGPLPVVLELAAPLLAVDGTLVAWRGERVPGDEEAGARAAAALGLEPGPVTATRPFAGARRHLHEFRKREPTPPRFPRRPGRAAKRPLA
jgi:16S rRNA (guanine527-N7)-methyltransferase